MNNFIAEIIKCFFDFIINIYHTINIFDNSVEKLVIKTIKNHLNGSESSFTRKIKYSDLRMNRNIRMHLEKDSLEADSLDILGIVTALDEKFNINIPAEAIDTIKTIKDVVVLVKKELQIN